MGINSYFKRIRVLGADKKGAALVEFALAMFPLFSLFFVQLQVASMFASHLILHHAAVAASRCSIIQQGPNLPGDFVSNKTGKDDNGDASTKCQQAAIDATGEGFWHKTLWNITVKNDYTAGCTDDTAAGHNVQYGDVTTTVTADFMCNVPLGAQVICGSMQGTKPLKIVIKETHEGACYTLDDNRNGG